MEENKQGDCAVCEGKEVVENGKCRNCGAEGLASKEFGAASSIAPSVDDSPKFASTE